MPNHVTHRLIITAATKEALDNFIVSVASKDENDSSAFCFETLVPTPICIQESESSSDVEIGLALLDRLDCSDRMFGAKTLDEFVAQYLSYSWVQSAGVTNKDELLDFLRKRHPEAEAKAMHAIKCKEETGHADWYSWRIQNWGTKWNAYSVDLERTDDTTVELKFDTAWSPPEPIFAAIAEKFPDLRIIGACFDEGWNFACGIKIGDGDCVILDAPNDHMDQLYAFVYGAWPEHDDEDEAQPIERDELPTPARVLEDLIKAKEAKEVAVAAQ